MFSMPRRIESMTAEKMFELPGNLRKIDELSKSARKGFELMRDKIAKAPIS